MFDAGGIARYLRARRPAFVVHAAALADTGYCEAHPQESEAVNLRAPEALAAACAGVGAKLVAFSSDQVYNGTELAGPLPETAPLAPVNVRPPQAGGGTPGAGRLPRGGVPAGQLDGATCPCRG